jgi:hypothetical protein
MALADAAMILAANALRTAITHAQLHTAAPNAAGTTNVSTAARQAITWGAATSDGDFTTSAALNFTGGAASGACTHVTYWSSAGTGSPPSGGTYYGVHALSGDTTFNAAGEYTVTSITENGSASG